MSKKGEEKERKWIMKVVERSQKRKAASKKSPKAIGPKEGLFTRISNFLKDVRREFKKVSWPPRRDTVSSTGVVVTVVFIFGFYFYIVDSIVGYLLKKMLTLGLN
jgi:preprotein translocase subunit SecE